MARVKRGVTTHARHKKVLELAKGYRGRGSTAYRIAIEKVEKALRYAYRDRRNRKRDFRALWIQRINAGVREHGLTYSQFMHGIKLAGLDLDRKVLSDIAIREPEAFAAIVSTARSALARRRRRRKRLESHTKYEEIAATPFLVIPTKVGTYFGRGYRPAPV